MIIADNQARPLGIGVSPNYVFWVNQRPAGLLRSAKNGRNLIRLDSAVDGVREPFDIASDSAEKLVYWTELTSNMVYRKAVLGGEKEGYGPGPSTAAFVVAEGSEAFISDYDPNGAAGVIQGGAGAAGQQVLYSERDVVAGLAVQSGVLYWARRHSAQIVAAPTIGGVVVNVVAETTADSRIMGVAADETFVYWVEDGLRIRRASKLAGTAVTIYESALPFGDSDIAVDDQFIFWTESGIGATASGVVRRLAK